MNNSEIKKTGLIYNDKGLILIYNYGRGHKAHLNAWFINDGCADTCFYSAGRKRASSDNKTEKGACCPEDTKFTNEKGKPDAGTGSWFTEGKPSLYRTRHHTRNEYGKAGRHHRNYKKEKVIFAG